MEYYFSYETYTVTTTMNNISSPLNCSDDLLLKRRFDFIKIITLLRSIVQVPLMLPLAVYVLYHGYQRWKPNKSLKSISHSDFFTYNMALTQILNTLGTIVDTCGLYTLSGGMRQAGQYLYGSHFITELLLHCLTCVDRYLAIVKPIFYLKLKQNLGLVIRNVFMGIVWLLSLGFMAFEHHSYPNYPVGLFVGTLIFTFLIVSFCSVYVLFALNQPGPGDRGQNRIDQSKLKAFHTIIAIMVAILIWVLGMSIAICLSEIVKINQTAKKVSFEVVTWISLPSSLVLLVLYFQRAVKCTLSN